MSTFYPPMSAGGPKPIAKPVVDIVNHPPHYTWLPNGLEAIDVTEQFNFNLGNALKYIIRSKHKGKEIQDLEKARWYIDREITRLNKEAGNAQ